MRFSNVDSVGQSERFGIGSADSTLGEALNLGSVLPCLLYSNTSLPGYQGHRPVTSSQHGERQPGYLADAGLLPLWGDLAKLHFSAVVLALTAWSRQIVVFVCWLLAHGGRQPSTSYLLK